MNEAVIALGSNINPEKNIPLALDNIKREFQLLRQSEFVYTEPIGYNKQPDFLNGAVLIRTPAAAEEVTATLKDIERHMGRRKNTPKYGPRKIDLDMVVFNGKVTDEDVFERSFLRNSIQEVLPDFEFPG